MHPVAAYVSVTDMDKSLAFYGKVFGRTPARIEDRYSYFDLDGFSFGLYNWKYDTEERLVGNNAVLCLKVTDIGAAYDRLIDLAPWIDKGIMTLKTIQLFQFKDLDGNLIEIFQDNS